MRRAPLCTLFPAVILAGVALADPPAAERGLQLDEIRSLAGQGSTAECVAFAPDGRRLAAAGFGRVVIWDVESGVQQVTIEEPDRWFMGVAFPPDGKTIAVTGSEQRVAVFDSATGKVVHSLSAIPKQESLTEFVGAVAFSPDGKTLASGASTGEITLWDTESGQLKGTVVAHEKGIDTIAYSSDGRRLATGSRDGTVRLWDATTIDAMREPLQTLRAAGETGHARTEVVFAADDDRLFSAGEFATIHEWDAQTGEKVRTLRGHGSGIAALAVAPDGTRLATSSLGDETLRMWDVRGGTALGVLRGLVHVPYAIAFSPTDAGLLATGDRDGLVRLRRFRGSEPLVAEEPVSGQPFVLRQEVGDDHDLVPPWQSFTAPLDGLITQVDLRPNCYGGAKGTFLIREGDIVDGRVLHEQAYEAESASGLPWHAFQLPQPVPVRKGAQYLWMLTGAHGIKSAKADVYPGGTAGGEADRDYCFRIHFEPLPAARDVTR